MVWEMIKEMVLAGGLDGVGDDGGDSMVDDGGDGVGDR